MCHGGERRSVWTTARTNKHGDVMTTDRADIGRITAQLVRAAARSYSYARETSGVTS